MTPRLLSLMSSVESSLASHECTSVRNPPERSVNFQKGIARMTFADGSGSIALQNFTLADGAICIKAEFTWAATNAVGSVSVYPTPDNFDWFGAAVKIAQSWLAGAKQKEIESAVVAERERLAAG